MRDTEENKDVYEGKELYNYYLRVYNVIGNDDLLNANGTQVNNHGVGREFCA